MRLDTGPSAEQATAFEGLLGASQALLAPGWPNPPALQAGLGHAWSSRPGGRRRGARGLAPAAAVARMAQFVRCCAG